MRNIIEIPKDWTFDLPVGTFNATIYSSKVRIKTNSYNTKEIRFLFEVNVPTMRNKIPLAGCSYDMDFRPGSKLRSFLETIKGTEWLQTMQGESFDLDTLNGTEVELDLHHVMRPPYNKPMVVIEDIRLPTTQFKQAA